MKQLQDYPGDIQYLLQEAKWHLEQLDILELNFRAWEENQKVKQTVSRAEQARLRWENRCKMIGDGLVEEVR